MKESTRWEMFMTPLRFKNAAIYTVDTSREMAMPHPHLRKIPSHGIIGQHRQRDAMKRSRFQDIDLRVAYCFLRFCSYYQLRRRAPRSMSHFLFRP